MPLPGLVVVTAAVLLSAGCAASRTDPTSPAQPGPASGRAASTLPPGSPAAPGPGSLPAPLPGGTGASEPGPVTASDLHYAAPGGDGDSWRDTRGAQYRLGLVNAPETTECFGAEATAERQRRTAAGFRAQVYTTDSYGRGVSVVTLADGTNLNVLLARTGYVDDRYLRQFRSQNPALAAQLDAAFAAAKAERAGLWGRCGDTVSPRTSPPARAPSPAAAAAGACHPAYSPCIPVQGGRVGVNGRANDLAVTSGRE